MIKVGNTRRNPLARAIRNAFDPRELFRPTTQGAIYAFDSFDYLYQKSDGSTPVTALEQPVGLVLDQRYGNAVGSELVQASYSGSVSGSWLIGSSSITRNGDTSGFASLTLSSGLTTTSRYVVTFTVSNFSGDDLGFRLGAAGTAYRISANGTYTFRVLPGATTAILRFLPWAGAAGQCTISAISVRELPGLHAYQSTDAARPVLKGTPRYVLFDRTDDHYVAATGGGGTTGFMLAGSIQPASAGTARTIFSDRGTNTGYKVEIDASNNLIFTAGNGTAFTTCTGPTLTAGTNYAFCVWHDGTNLNIKVGASGSVASQAFATASAGTSTLTLFKDNAAASGYFSGRLYALTYIRNATGINESVASQLIGWSATKGGFAP